MDMTEHSGKAASIDLSEYPKEVTLKDSLIVTFRPMVQEDMDLLVQFALSLPERERTFLRDDIINPEVMNTRSSDTAPEDTLTILACHGDRIVGCARLNRYPFPWNRHMGNIRVTISPECRRKGLARTLLGEMFCKALPTGIEKVITEVVAGQEDARSAMTQLGFREEAVLSDHHLDPQGSKHDVLVMSSDLNQLWDKWCQYSETISGTWDMED